MAKAIGNVVYDSESGRFVHASESVESAPIVTASAGNVFRTPMGGVAVLAGILAMGYVGYWLHKPGSDSEYVKARRMWFASEKLRRKAEKDRLRAIGDAQVERVRAAAGGLNRAETSVVRQVLGGHYYRRGTAKYRTAAGLERAGILSSTRAQDGRVFRFTRKYSLRL